MKKLLIPFLLFLAAPLWAVPKFGLQAATSDLNPGSYNLVPGQYNFMVLGPTPTPTPMPTPSPTPVPGTFNIGETSSNLEYEDGGNGNLVLAQDVVLAQVATLQSLSFYVIGPPTGTLALGFYDASGPNGGPGRLVASTAQFTPVAGWNTAPVALPVALQTGNYWLAYNPSANNLHFPLTGQSGSHKYADATSLPAAFPALKGNGTGHWSLYATLTPGGNPSPTPTPVPTPTPTPTPVPTPTPPAGNHIMWFGAACPGNINWTYNGNQPSSKYFRMLQPDGFQGWMVGGYGFSIENGRGANGAMYDYAKAHNMKVRCFLGPAPGGKSRADLQNFLAWLATGAGKMPNIDVWNLSNEPMSIGYSSWITSQMSGLGGKGSTGWDWAINLYKDVKKYFPNSLCGFNQWGCETSATDAFTAYKDMNRILWANHAIDYIGLEMYFCNFGGRNWRWTQSQIKAGLDAYHAACPGCPIHITEITCVDTNDTEQSQLIQGAIAAYKADPLVTAISTWTPDGNVMDAESGAGSGLFYGSNFRPAYNWLIQNFPLPTPP